MKTKLNYKRSVFVATLGNIMEWYDFAIFGYFSPIIGHVFFPGSMPAMALIKSFLVFSVGYLIRPIGGVIFGFIGDKYGRRMSLSISFFIMAISTSLIGFLPGFHAAGIAAALLLCILRILQGLSAGGELVGTSTYIYEIVPQSNNGFWSSMNTTSSIVGVLVGSLIATIFYHFFGADFLYAYGWRIGFWIGGFLMVPAVLFFPRMTENDNWENSKLKYKKHFYAIFKRHHLSVISVFLVNILMSVGFYVMFLWLPTYFGGFLNKQPGYIIGLNTAAILFLVILIPLAGHLSDKFGSINLATLSSLLILLLSPPLFYLIAKGEIFLLAFSQFVFCVIFCSIEATMPKIMAKQFPTESRFSGTAISYNLSTSLFGGTAPLVCTLLMASTKTLMSVAVYLMLCCFLALCGYLIIFLNKKRL